MQPRLDHFAAAPQLMRAMLQFSQAVSAGIYSPNEIRAMENRGPYAGGEVYTRPLNTAPVRADGTAEEPSDAD